jgi:hypothetical protein
MNTMQKNNLTTFISFILIALSIQNAYADVSLFAVSNNLMEPLHVFAEVVYNICYIVAISLFFATLAQYRAYRLSPNQTPLNRPIMLLILSAIVALLPFIAQLSEASKYTKGL